MKSIGYILELVNNSPTPENSPEKQPELVCSLTDFQLFRCVHFRDFMVIHMEHGVGLVAGVALLVTLGIGHTTMLEAVQAKPFLFGDDARVNRRPHQPLPCAVPAGF